MVKECKVFLNNQYVTVIKFNDTDVQLPSIKKEADTIFVKYENGKYSVVDKLEPEKEEIKTEIVPRRNKVRKTTDLETLSEITDVKADVE